MSQHLKTKVFSILTDTIFRSVPSPVLATHHARGVRYLKPITSIKFYYGAMTSVKEGRKYRKHIIVRRAPRFQGLHQLYTYHFPKTWSAACVANRELIKTAQKLAHALEHDYSLAGIEWTIRFFKHYYRVFKGGAKPEPGLKPYSRFYQYTYVAIYRELQAARDKAQEPVEIPSEEITFSPINLRPHLHSAHSGATVYSLKNIVERAEPPLWKQFEKIVA